MEQGELHSTPEEFVTEEAHMSDISRSPEKLEVEDALDIKPPQVKLPKKKKDKRHSKKRSADKEQRKREKQEDRERAKHRSRDRASKEDRPPKDPQRQERDRRDGDRSRDKSKSDSRGMIKSVIEHLDPAQLRGEQRDTRDYDKRDPRDYRDGRDNIEVRDKREVDRREVIDLSREKESRGRDKGDQMIVRDTRSKSGDPRKGDPYRDQDPYLDAKERDPRGDRDRDRDYEDRKDKKPKSKKEREEENKRREKSRVERERLERLEMERRRLDRERQRQEQEIQRNAERDREREREKRRADEKRKAREELARRRDKEGYRSDKRSRSKSPRGAEKRSSSHMTREEVTKRRRHGDDGFRKEDDEEEILLVEGESSRNQQAAASGSGRRQSPDDEEDQATQSPEKSESDESDDDSGSESDDSSASESSGSPPTQSLRSNGDEEEEIGRTTNHHRRSKFEDDVNELPAASPVPSDIEFLRSDDEDERYPPSPSPDSTPEDARYAALPNYYPALDGCRNVDEFHCLNRIEEGTYGVVYRAKDKKTNQVVALKRLKMEKEKEGFPITSLREVNTLLKAQHPNIVTVREIVVGSNMDKIYIVMDYVEHDLKSLMESMKAPFLIGEVKTLLYQLLCGVAHLHDNWIIHRDLKTSNLLLSHKGILKIGDFGLAREYGSPLKPYTPIVVTLWYRSPELLLGCKEYSTAVDMWSVGCIFAEFLLKAPLFPGKTELDQLNRIFKELGTPTEKIWPGVTELPHMKKINFTEYPYNKLRNRIDQTVTEKGFDLMNSFLTYSPERRVDAAVAVKDEYFKEAPLPIDPAMFPTWPAKSEQSRKHGNTPKPPSGGMAFKKMLGDDDLLSQNSGFHLGGDTQNSGFHLGGETRGTGFSLKF